MSTSKSSLLKCLEQAHRDKILLSRPFLSIVTTSSRYGLKSTTSFSFSSTSIVIRASGAALRRAWIKGVVKVKSPKCIKNVTSIFLPLSSTITASCFSRYKPHIPSQVLCHTYNASRHILFLNTRHMQPYSK